GHHPQSVTATFRLSLEQVERELAAAADLLRVCAFVQAEAIPEELFVAGAAHLGSQLEVLAADPTHFDQAIAVLRHLSLIQRQAETHTLSLHRLVQAVLLDAMTQEEREQWIRRVIAALDAGFPEVLPATERAAWVHSERLLPHAMRVLHRVKDVEESLAIASLAYKAAQYLRERGRYREAEPLFQRACTLRERILGPDNPDVACILNYMAVLYWSQGRYAEAEPLYQRAIHIWEQTLGSEHPDVARPLNNLAELYVFQGRHTEAEALHWRALHIWKQALGLNHPLVATSLMNLAYLCVEQGRYAQAEPLYQRTLGIWEHVRQPDHPLTAAALANLARLYGFQGNYTEAERLYLRAIHIQERVLGPDHPDLGITLNGLAELFQTMGKYAEAERLAQRARSIFEQALEPDHPSVALTLRTLANLSRDQDRDAEAASFYQRALRIQEQQLGPQHPKTAHTLHDLALLRQKQGHLSEAQTLARCALQIQVQALGEAHPKTIATRALYSQLVQEQAASAEKTASEQEGEALAGAYNGACQTEEASLSLHKGGDMSSSAGDPLQAFLDACCELHPRAWCRSADLWQAYQRWVEQSQECYPLSRGTFIAQLKARGCRADRTKIARIWRGIALVKTGVDGG
ncbi:MAG: tetratricopeptide repeat protein, partial [Chloroflexi bacterium]|nr:tetratricopeptide repeat protein [Chloroflexota bacterium]